MLFPEDSGKRGPKVKRRRKYPLTHTTLTMLLVLRVALLASCATHAVGSEWRQLDQHAAGQARPNRAVSWWWSAPTSSQSPFGNDTGTDGLLT